ncbi:MAG: 2-phospho-L-lactate guanylyltransferase [Nitrososphaera sp.]|nr:2-phospho-L-lactate guanylyltransferase [Nitrososphaera sp.]
MKIFAIIPVKRFENSKTRMSSILELEDRILLSSLMLEDTLRLLKTVPDLQRIVVVSSDRRAEEITGRHGCSFLIEHKESGVNSAVLVADQYSVSEGADATIVIPQDLPLLDPLDITMMCDLAKDEKRCIIICPSQRYDGTNALLRKPPSAISTFFDNNSYENHINAARESGISPRLFLSKNLMLDIDTPEDAMQLVREGNKHESKVLGFLKRKLTE